MQKQIMTERLQKEIIKGIKASTRPDADYYAVIKLATRYVNHVSNLIKEANSKGANCFFVLDFEVGKGHYLMSSYALGSKGWELVQPDDEIPFQVVQL